MEDNQISEYPILTTGSEIRRYFEELGDWKALINSKWFDFKEVQKYLLEYPEYLYQILLMSDFMFCGNEIQQVRAFVDFLTSFPDGTQRTDSAVLTLFSGGDGDFRFFEWYELDDLNGFEVPEFITDIAKLMSIVAIDGGRDTGIHFWTQIKKALLDIRDFSNADNEVVIALKRYVLRCDDPGIFYCLQKVIRREAIYEGIMEYDSEEFNESLRKTKKKDIRLRMALLK